MREAPIDLNFFMTGEVLSWVITCRGRIDRESPARTSRPWGPALMCAWALVSTMVCPMGSSRPLAVRPGERHERADRADLLAAPDRVLELGAGPGRENRLGQGVEFLLDLAVRERVSGIA